MPVFQYRCENQSVCPAARPAERKEREAKRREAEREKKGEAVPDRKLNDLVQELHLEDVLPDLILFLLLERHIILPPDDAAALLAQDVPHDVPARRHVALDGGAGFDVRHG